MPVPIPDPQIFIKYGLLGLCFFILIVFFVFGWLVFRNHRKDVNGLVNKNERLHKANREQGEEVVKLTTACIQHIKESTEVLKKCQQPSSPGGG